MGCVCTCMCEWVCVALHTSINMDFISSWRANVTLYNRSTDLRLFFQSI